ncbi:hypothetical protein [Haloglycomyces albus]|uniref:hypothetical protein n=1 Tax=Haloglycomyces albus TaxID=526067 RepID=UPI00046D1DE1|nr:hypothetical protein [Haloglycomyces albus]
MKLAIDTRPYKFRVSEDPEVKTFVDAETGEVKEVKRDGKPVWVVTVFMKLADADPETGRKAKGAEIKVSMTSIPEVEDGQLVDFGNLQASEWEFKDKTTGEPRHGLSFKASSVAAL